MSKFFYKGRIEKKPKHESFGFNTKRAVKPGSAELPLKLTVTSEQRKQELASVAAEHQLVVNITVDDTAEENIQELDVVISKPITATFDKKPNRNDPCSCGSGKKYKKCCA
ncbi:SEC-C metal-binding domain-containing protein [Agarivorans sp. TSD2052]|uniref:PBPRA1643 family SWIM/SEC-C metal-binding motif protein n=1 Tax=Agarivorans sp. TSD2052 TaxID=2937286 RepID=UPI00200CEBB5|nr:PBPRA1643 family SWIM/SEC-C metal-binding motif protein [Agarivorans sp. TSD2052]UPW20512.1 SEC-C metal-binding domain-containing protein [Agarivorans sp. TSD2052]